MPSFEKRRQCRRCRRRSDRFSRDAARGGVAVSPRLDGMAHASRSIRVAARDKLTRRTGALPLRPVAAASATQAEPPPAAALCSALRVHDHDGAAGCVRDAVRNVAEHRPRAAAHADIPDDEDVDLLLVRRPPAGAIARGRASSSRMTRPPLALASAGVCARLAAAGRLRREAGAPARRATAHARPRLLPLGRCYRIPAPRRVAARRIRVRERLLRGAVVLCDARKEGRLAGRPSTSWLCDDLY